MFSTLAPRVSKIRLTFAFCSAKPIWMPRKPKLMFQISQNVRRGLERTARGAAAWAVMEILDVKVQRAGRMRIAWPPPGASRRGAGSRR